MLITYILLKSQSKSEWLKDDPQNFYSWVQRGEPLFKLEAGCISFREGITYIPERFPILILYSFWAVKWPFSLTARITLHRSRHVRSVVKSLKVDEKVEEGKAGVYSLCGIKGHRERDV